MDKVFRLAMRLGCQRHHPPAKQRSHHGRTQDFTMKGDSQGWIQEFSKRGRTRGLGTAVSQWCPGAKG